MSGRVLLVGLLLLLVSGCRDQGAVKLTVKLEGFKPRCVRLRVEDPANADGTRQTKDLVKELEGRAVGDTLTVAAFRKSGWSNTLRLTAQSFETISSKGECSGTPVDERIQEVAVARGERAEVAVTLSAVDADNDGYARTTLGPDGPRGGDCDDTSGAINPAATEICNLRDDNCDNVTDEGFHVGQSCEAGPSCQSTWSCTAQGQEECLPPVRYADTDGDGHGDREVTTRVCPLTAGLSAKGDDCDDGNPFTHPGAPELCDQDDNDCDTLTDEGVCPAGGGAWVSQDTSDGNLRSISLWGEGGVWVAGQGGRLRVRAPNQPSFSVLDSKCPGDWFSVWAEPAPSGRGVFVGSGSALQSHGPSGDGLCDVPLLPLEMDARGLFGVLLPNGQYEAHFVGLSGTAGKAKWGGYRSGATLTPNDAPLSPLYDIHGLSRGLLFAVGGSKAEGPRIYRFNNSATAPGWMSQQVEKLPDVVNGRLLGVWVVNDKLAYAVGEGGSVLMWNGEDWSVHPGPPGNEDLRSVVAFGRNSIYVSTGKEGMSTANVFRYADKTWTPMSPSDPKGVLYDIAGRSPGDLWVVGVNGQLLHWPK